ncbi:hypothetical protein QTO34_018356 [Cnephaeus nilssonii]|uniref:AB hydrolase-1 domain-containing protein n=1 Tax=Cnephaeus nilssonii TaxID=3371016 RepID=A0AA40HYN9_CNENI|nr:hypothetical protein QTO34_018356 [Eptesicus nilssonii]
MARLRDCLPRLMSAIRSLLFWSLVYGYGGLCASVHLLKLLWSVGTGPAQTFRRGAREHPPPGLNDPSLGTHCYVRVKKEANHLCCYFMDFQNSGSFKSEYRVVALDLRGYGETDAPIHRESYKLDCLITDIKDVLDSLGYSKCVLIGHDWGGMIAWLIAICYPEMVMKLIVINFPHPNVFTEYILRHPTQLFKSSYYYFFQIPWFPEFMFSINDFKALKHLFTSRRTGIRRKGCQLTTEDLEAYIYVFSQPGALSGPINHYRNIFRSV